MGRWQEIDHTADFALHIWAEDLPDLFVTAARGMFALIATMDDASVSSAMAITLSAPDVETLLVDWLNELLYLSEVQEQGFVDFAFETLTATRLLATVQGRRIVAYQTYIKAATFHNLAVTRTKSGYETEIVFDT